VCSSDLEVQEIQTALGLVAAGLGLCVVPAGVSRLRPDEVVYRALSDPQAVSPIIMSTRLHDQNDDIVLLRALIDRIYQEQGEMLRRAAGLPADAGGDGVAAVQPAARVR
jgi:DNA-binding transcriptional LysR family regulator